MSHLQSFLKRRLTGPGDNAILLLNHPVVHDLDGMAKQNMEAAAAENKIRYDKLRKAESYKQGEFVLLSSHKLSNMKQNFSAKLAPK